MLRLDTPACGSDPHLCWIEFFDGAVDRYDGLSVTTTPRPRTRRITPDHARFVAGTGGVIGIWPPASLFPDLSALAEGIARMADVVGPAHVGLGSDMMGLVGPSALPDSSDLPDLAAHLLMRFTPEEVGGILGGNYLRVPEACLAP